MMQASHNRCYWAKSDRKAPDLIHLLEHHLADVGACFEALLEQPTIRRRLVRGVNGTLVWLHRMLREDIFAGSDTFAQAALMRQKLMEWPESTGASTSSHTTFPHRT